MQSVFSEQIDVHPKNSYRSQTETGRGNRSAACGCRFRASLSDDFIYASNLQDGNLVMSVAVCHQVVFLRQGRSFARAGGIRYVVSWQ